MSPVGELDSYPGDITLDVIPSAGAPVDLSDLMDRDTIAVRAARLGAPGDPGSFSVTIEDEGGVLIDALSDEAEVRVYSKDDPGSPYRRLFHGYLKSRTLGTLGRETLVTQIGCTGDAILIDEPPYQLTATFRAGAVPWLPNHPYEVGDVVRAVPDINHRFTCTIAGTSLDDPQGPVWNTASGGFTTDGGVQWQESGPSFMTDREVLLELLPLYFDTAVQLTGISTLIAAMPYLEFEAGKPLSECLSEIAGFATSATYDPWVADTDYSPGDLMEPVPSNGYYYQAMNSGISGTSQPAWGTVIGAITTEIGGTGPVEWMNMGRTSVVPVWGMQTPSDNSAHTAVWTPIFKWVDVNDPVSVPTLSVGYSDQTAEDATHIHLEDLTLTRETTESANVVYVFGDNYAAGLAEDTVRIAAERRRRSVAIMDSDCQTNADCDAAANKYLSLLQTRETGSGTARKLPDSATLLSLRTLQKVRLTNALYGLSDEVYPLTEAGVAFGSELAEYSVSFGSGFLGSTDDVLSSRAGGRRFAFDHTPPAPVTWETNPADPNYWVLDNVYQPHARRGSEVVVQVQWLSGNESDLDHFHVEASVSGEARRRVIGNIYYPTQAVTVGGLPASVAGEPQTIQFYVLAVDTRGNYLRDETGGPVYSLSPVLALASADPPDPPENFALVSDVYNPASGKAEFTFDWDPSPSPGVALYQIMSYASGGYSVVWEGDQDTTSAVVEWEAGAPYEIRARALDSSGNEGLMTDPALTGTAAAGIYPALYNPSFEFRTRQSATQAAGWTYLTSGTGSTVERVTTDAQDGVASLKLTVTGTATEYAMAESALFYVRPGARYSWGYYLRNAAQSDNANLEVDWYDVTHALISTETLHSPLTIGTTWTYRGLITFGGGFLTPSNADHARIRLGNRDGSVATSLYVDNIYFGPELMDEDLRATEEEPGTFFGQFAIDGEGRITRVIDRSAELRAEVSLIDRARMAPGWRNLGSLTGNAFRESDIVHDGTNYYVFSTHVYESNNVAVRSASTLEGIVGATPTTGIVSGLYPSVVKNGSTWHMWVRETGANVTKHYTSASPTSGWTYSDTISPNLNDCYVRKHPTNGYWYLIGFLSGSDQPLTLLRASDPAGPWTDMGDVFADQGEPPFGNTSRPDPGLALGVDGRDYIFFSGAPTTVLSVNYHPSIQEIDLSTGRVKGSPVVLLDQRDPWMVSTGGLTTHGISELAFLRVSGEPDRIFAFANDNGAGGDWPWGCLELPRTVLPTDGRRTDDLVRLDTARGFDVAAGIRPVLLSGAAWTREGLYISISGGAAQGYPAVAKLRDFTALVDFTPDSIAAAAVNSLGMVAGPSYSAGPYISIYIDTDGTLKAEIDGDSGSAVILTSGITPKVGQRYTAVFRKAGTVVQLWVDGALVDTDAHSVDLTGLEVWSIAGQKTLTQAVRYPFVGTIHAWTVVGASLPLQNTRTYAPSTGWEYLPAKTVLRSGELHWSRGLTDSADRRNWAGVNEVAAAGDFHLMQSTSNTGAGTTRSVMSWNKDRVAKTYGSLVIGSAALATNATDGFLYIPTCAGVPTGTPTAQTGTVPLVWDSTNNHLYIYRGGAWVLLI